MNKTSDIDLLLIGKTGNGKSALGNTILRRYAFASKSSTSSVTKAVSFEVSEYKGKIIKVVDGPGVGDTRLDNESAKEMVAKKMEEAINVNPQGYHAFLLVVKFGCRLTAEDQDTINFLKDCFGPNFVCEFCIVVFTFGDLFESEARETGPTFDQWCREQDDVFQKMLRECGSRFVLFDNKTKDKQKQEAQIDELLRIVSCLQSQGHRYTDMNFELAQEAREKAIVESQKPVVREEITQETSLILQKLDEVRKNFQDDKQIPHLKQLLLRVDRLIEYVRDQDKGTGALKEIEESVVSLKKSIDDSIRVQSAVAGERKKMEEKEKKMKARMDQEMQKIKDNFNERQKRFEEEQKEMKKEFDRKLKETEEKHTKTKDAMERAAAEYKKQLGERDKEIKANMEQIIRMQKDKFDEMMAQQKKKEEEQREMAKEMAKKEKEWKEKMSKEKETMERALAENRKQTNELHEMVTEKVFHVIQGHREEMKVLVAEQKKKEEDWKKERESIKELQEQKEEEARAREEEFKKKYTQEQQETLKQLKEIKRKLSDTKCILQ